MTDLVVREDERVGQHDVFAPPDGEDDDLGDVVGRERLDAPGERTEGQSSLLCAQPPARSRQATGEKRSTH